MITRNQSKLIRNLRSRKRQETGKFLVEGVRLVEELLASDLEIDFLVTTPALLGTPRGRRLRELIAARHGSAVEASDAELGRLADTETPQGVLAVAGQPAARLADYRPAARAAVLVLDRLADPGNVGTLLRTARALGVTWVVGLPGTVDAWSPKVVRAAAGSLFRLPVSQEPWPEVRDWLRRHRFAILCADPGGDAVPRGGAAEERFALVLGNEPSGLSDEVREDCDRRVSIAMPGDMDSLNVAVAGALLLDRLLAAAAPE
jgi:TrmH family RNA methyltransferase